MPPDAITHIMAVFVLGGIACRNHVTLAQTLSFEVESLDKSRTAPDPPLCMVLIAKHSIQRHTTAKQCSLVILNYCICVMQCGGINRASKRQTSLLDAPRRYP